MELVNILSKVVKENLTTKKILLEYPESTVKKLLDKFTKETDETEDVIRKTISDFERFKSSLSNEDKDICEFGKLSRSDDGLMYCCKQCNNKRSKEYRSNNPEKSNNSNN